ncbi:MAG: ribosome biogenesis GTPase YlqF [Firmicutes bacterium]|nr:ribosome biogenesis GTPase YlqF [Bacillota bacterium]
MAQGKQIQWYPGHMTKTRRQIEADLKQVDAVCEIVDARIPRASRNPDIDELCANKPRIVILNRMDLADPALCRRWVSAFREKGVIAVPTDCKSRRGIADFPAAAAQAMQEKIARSTAKGMSPVCRIMVVGIPNVGKSTFINQISGRRSARAENRPGVTRGKQWVAVDKSLLLLDTPGILWPKFEDPEVGRLLAYTGAVKDGILDMEELASGLLELLWQRYPDSLRGRYALTAAAQTPGWELLDLAARKRGYLLAGGEVNTERMAQVLLEEFRSGKLGRFTLEQP